MLNPTYYEFMTLMTGLSLVSFTWVWTIQPAISNLRLFVLILSSVIGILTILLRVRHEECG